ncbi:glycine betaine/proline transport system substrate-binding protein (plasmid) [Ketogulonicigenium robustum]|uniref:Glycine betaine/proline transport system substrate-binding protein n=1 Tax=Ketogulonicigenium robustum TaxID=92947 RepID=A0A1W6P351_9RHOB|nr:ABC transporter substrate-binding protein [Ketogulonicigenium robustum]ARO15935.1 glycine betaine/proline transport system substrate-binding protein [Ketogulonicigenium robustum]
MTKLVYASLLAIAPAAMALPAMAQDNDQCGTVSIAEMNWASAGVAAWVDKIVLEEGYGCNVDLVTGDTMPTFASMNERGQPDIAPEIWANAVKDPLEAALAEGRLIEASKILEDGGVEGWWIPRYVAEAHPEITSVEEALKHPDLFPAPENPARGGVYGCPSGWSCQITTQNLFHALDAEGKGFDLVDTGSAAGLDGSIANAYEREAGWLGYYWAPTAILGRYDMVQLPFEVPVDEAEFLRCTTIPDCPDPKVTSYPVADVYTIVTKNLAETNPVVMGYLGQRTWKNDVVNAILAWQTENQATNEDAAWHFLETFPEIWGGWLSDDVRARVADAI